MATLTKFNCFVGDLGIKAHQLNTDVLKWYLTNATPVATNTVYNTPADLATGGGYTAGGVAATNTYSQTSGVGTLSGSSATITSTSAIGPFRYAVLYNSTSGTLPLIGYVDYGSSISLATGESFTISVTSILTIT